MVRLGLAIVATMAAVLAGPATAEPGDPSTSERKAIAASGLPQGSVVAVKSGMVVAIRNRGAISMTGAVVEGVVLHGEVVSADAAQFLGYRSMRSTVDIDCLRRRDLVTNMTVYSKPGAKGAAVVRQVPGGWAQPSPDAYLAAVITSVCGGAPQKTAAATPPPAMDAAEIGAERPVRVASAPRSRPAPLPAEPPVELLPRRATPEPVGPDQPMRTALEARYRAPSAQLISNSEAPELRPAISPSPAPAPKAPPQPAPKPVPAPAKPAPAKPAPAKPAPAKPAPKPTGAPGKLSVQIAASPSEGQARAALAKVKVAAPLSTEVQTVVLDGKTFHRALVRGFKSRAEAKAFCGSLKGDCFIR